jgi:hypothetical protein
MVFDSLTLATMALAVGVLAYTGYIFRLILNTQPLGPVVRWPGKYAVLLPSETTYVRAAAAVSPAFVTRLLQRHAHSDPRGHHF